MALIPSNTLSRSQTRVFVAVLVALIFGLSIVATVMITRGWNNPTVQEQVREQETERRLAMPRLGGDEVAPDPTP